MRLVTGFLDRVADRPVILMGNSLGGLVAALAAASAPDRVAGLVLVDPALPTERLGLVHPRVVANFAVCSVPGVGERFLTARRNRTTAERTVRRVLAATCVDPSRVPADVVDAHIELTAGGGPDGGRSGLPGLGPLARPRHGPLRDRRSPGSTPSTSRCSTCTGPGTCWCRSARPDGWPRVGADWQLEVARDIGHAPMLETPVWTGTAHRRVACRRRGGGVRPGRRVGRARGRRQLTWRSSPSQ